MTRVIPKNDKPVSRTAQITYPYICTHVQTRLDEICTMVSLPPADTHPTAGGSPETTAAPPAPPVGPCYTSRAGTKRDGGWYHDLVHVSAVASSRESRETTPYEQCHDDLPSQGPRGWEGGGTNSGPGTAGMRAPICTRSPGTTGHRPEPWVARKQHCCCCWPGLNP